MKERKKERETIDDGSISAFTPVHDRSEIRIHMFF